MKMEKTELSGLIVLFLGVILLAFTFFSAYGFLSGELSILTSADLTELFGNAMAPLITAIIRILYLGIMGWVGSILTIRAIQLLKREKETPTMQPQVKPQTTQSVTTTSATPVAKPEPKQAIKESKNPEKPQVQEQPAEPAKEVKAT